MINSTTESGDTDIPQGNEQQTLEREDLVRNNKPTSPIPKLSKFLHSLLAQKLNVQNCQSENNFNELEKSHLVFKSKILEKLFQECNENVEGVCVSFKQKKFSKLIDLFQTCENYYSIMILSGGNAGDDYEAQNTPASTLTAENVRCRTKKTEFYKCGLCMHYLNDPITLVCGCTFCKMCLEEFNHSQFQIAVLKQCTDPIKHLYKCRNCGFSHNQNSSQYISTNISISKIVDKSFGPQIESRLLRNDIRKCIYLKLIDFNKAVSLLKQAFLMGKLYPVKF